MVRLSFAVAAVAALTACAPTPDTVTRSAPQNTPPVIALPSLRVSDITVTVPETLQVSEENAYYPSGDIVWRGDPMGNRHEQVKAIFEQAMRDGTAELGGARAVLVNVQVQRFHALTEKARYSIGGVHALTFAYQVVDADTGEILQGPKVVRADLEGLGGREAIAADQRGETQKKRITDHLAKVIATELTQPGGYQHRELGILGQLNRT